MSHELVHVVVNDQTASPEAFSGALLSKVPPEPEQPLSIIYSVLTNRARYTPRWQQEGIAVFLETWLSGGFGNSLGNFDEAYFRSMVVEGKPLLEPEVLEATETKVSFLLDTLHYLYGTRFVTHLVATYGVESVLEWYQSPGGYRDQFHRVFGKTFESAWAEFQASEIDFQKLNLTRLDAAPLTSLDTLSGSMGWVSHPGLDSGRGRIVLARHRPHRLAGIVSLDLSTGAVDELATLPTPGLTRVSSTTIDPKRRAFFYTTNNNQLFRDVRRLDLDTGATEILFGDARVGELAVSSETGELWGVRHTGGIASLVVSEAPYDTLETIASLGPGESIQHLAASPTGAQLAATLHRSSGRQSIVLIDVDATRKAGTLEIRVVSNDGSPEFPSWSPDETSIYWNAYTNGVSNVYRHRLEDGTTAAMSHTLRGLYQPVYLDDESLFAFELTTEGFVPVRLPNVTVTKLPATRYFGQNALEQSPELMAWNTKLDEAPRIDSNPRAYTSGVRVHSLLPTVSGFQDQTVFGLYGHLVDPLSTHDITFEAGVTPFTDGHDVSTLHVRAAYQYMGTYRLDFEHNASSFYDLFNPRKKSSGGTMVAFTHNRFWTYDQPHQLTQSTQVAFFAGIDAIEDNLVEVSTPDVLTAQTTLQSRNLRRAIGSIDFESGNAWSTTVSAIGARGENLEGALGIHGDWERFTTFARPHNVLRTQLAAGYRHADEDLEVGRFYFGGFGNQYVEDQDPKQYRQIFRFPGAPYASVSGRTFAKLSVENGLPPLRFARARADGHFLSHIDASWFAQGLVVGPDRFETWGNLGGQVNMAFRLWSNLDSTVSFGMARAWSGGSAFNEWFLSVRLLR